VPGLLPRTCPGQARSRVLEGLPAVTLCAICGAYFHNHWVVPWLCFLRYGLHVPGDAAGVKGPTPPRILCSQPCAESTTQRVRHLLIAQTKSSLALQYLPSKSSICLNAWAWLTPHVSGITPTHNRSQHSTCPLPILELPFGKQDETFCTDKDRTPSLGCQLEL